MKMISMTSLGALAIASAALVAAGSASAQTSGIATASAPDAILSAKAFAAANTAISAQFKPQLDQAAARQTALNTQLKTIVDTNKDGNVSQDEYTASQTATNPVAQRVRAAEQAAAPELDRLRNPAILAQAYALEQVGLKYDAALQAVIRAKNINIVLAPNAVQYAPPATDVTRDIIAELDRSTPTVPTTPPANWQPAQDTVQLLQSYRQALYQQELRRQQQGATAPAAGTGARPATPPAAPATTPRPSSGR